MGVKLEVRKATAPYFKPWVVLISGTRKVVRHCSTMQEAQRYCERHSERDDEIQPSEIQPSRNAADVQHNRLQNPLGDPSDEPEHVYGEKPKRSIKI